MYALIWDEHQLDSPKKKVISVHESREADDTALENRQKELGKRVWECHTRIVWVEKDFRAGDVVGPGEYVNWRSGEKIPDGEMYSDSD